MPPSTNTPVASTPIPTSFDRSLFPTNGYDNVQLVANDNTRMAPEYFEFREMTVDDIEDDCPVCQLNRELILAGKPPMAYVQKPAGD